MSDSGVSVFHSIHTWSSGRRRDGKFARTLVWLLPEPSFPRLRRTLGYALRLACSPVGKHPRLLRKRPHGQLCRTLRSISDKRSSCLGWSRNQPVMPPFENGSASI